MEYIAKLENLRAISINGEDALEFLSNQFTSDIGQIGEKEIRQSAWCDPKGRVLFAPLVYKNADNYGCLLASDQVDNFCRRLSMFVLRSKVEITELDEVDIWGLQLDASDPPETLAGSGLTVLRFVDSGTGLQNGVRYYAIGDGDALEKLVVQTALPREDERWRIDQIVAGLPELNAALSGEFLPQQLNLDALHAVSFSKGCYPGQEIIARLKYRGKVKQRLYRLTSTDKHNRPQTISAPADLFSTDDPDTKIGRLISFGASESHSYALAVLDVEAAKKAGNIVRIADSDGLYSIESPPYQIPE